MHAAKKYVEIKCLKICQPIGEFYVGVMQHSDLVRISYTDVRRIERRDVERYLGIERPLSPDRVAELRQYVNLVDATFPSSIILAVSSENAEFLDDKNIMRVRNEQNVAKIIDGQHRIAGLENFTHNSFQVNITIFVDMDIEDQAMVFATINLKQTKVSKSLSYDLYEYAKSRSPQKTCHNIAKLLNNKDGSPFKDKIKILGVATGKPAETLTQAIFVDRLMPYISDDPLSDRDMLKRGKRLSKVSELESRRLIFRDLFVGEKDAQIARVLWNYFSAVEERWPHAWKEKIKGNILNRSNGFGALMKFLRPLYLKLNGRKQIIEKAEFHGILRRIQLSGSDFTPDRYKPGASGESMLYKDLCVLSNVGEI